MYSYTVRNHSVEKMLITAVSDKTVLIWSLPSLNEKTGFSCKWTCWSYNWSKKSLLTVKVKHCVRTDSDIIRGWRSEEWFLFFKKVKGKVSEDEKGRQVSVVLRTEEKGEIFTEDKRI